MQTAVKFPDFSKLYPWGGGGHPYTGIYGEAFPERGTFLGWRYVEGYGFYELNYENGLGSVI